MSSSPPQSSLRSVGLVTGLTFVQLLVQFVLQRVLAQHLGATAEMDVYVAALGLPVVISAVFAGSLGYVLVPIYAERQSAAGERAAAVVTNQIGLGLLAVSLVVAAVMATFAGPLAAALFRGFSGEQLALAARLLQILASLIVLNSLVSFLNIVAQCRRRFVLPVAAGIVGTLATVAYVVLLIERQGILAAAYGVALGAATTAAILLPLWLGQFRDPEARRLTLDPAVRRCWLLLWPLLLGSLYWRLDPLLDRYLGSFLSPGSLAHLGYAWRLTSALMMVGTSGLSVVAFPALAAHAAAGRRDELSAEIAHAWRLLIVMLVPVAAGLIGFSEPVTRLLYEQGRFLPADTRVVAWLIVLYLGVVIGAGFGDLLSRVFYALYDTRTPVLVGLAGFTLGAALKLLLLAPWGVAGLAGATSLFYLFNVAVLTVILLRRLGPAVLAGTSTCLLRSTSCALAACLAAYAVNRIAAPLAVLGAAVAGGLVYVVGLWLLGDEFARRLYRTNWRT